MAPQIVATDDSGRPVYKNLDKLKEKIQPHAYRKTKAECFDLPPKLFVKQYFEMEKQQEKLYNSLRQHQKAFFQDELVTVVQKMTLLMRLSQLVRGYMIDENDNLTPLFPDPRKNPAIQTMLDSFEERNQQTIVWCRFKHEIRDVMEVLGNEAVDYYGDTSGDDREKNMYLFKNGHKKYFVGTVDAGGIGLDLHEASMTFFYSNQFSSEKRMQAEDRNHRYGTEGALSQFGHGVLYEDLICPGTVDEYILKLLAAKKEISEYMMDLRVVYDA
jgi:SNF2 family DNA or RNA helicase